MRLSASAKLWSITLGTVVIAAIVIWFSLHSLDRINRANANAAINNPAREAYAALYDAAWRPDQQNDSVLMTATLMTPELIAALDGDPQRQSAEDQILGVVKDLPASSIALLVTADSVSGAIPDADFVQNLTLTTDPAHAFSGSRWHPLIVPSHVVNASNSTTSQIGIMVFSSDTDIAWSDLKQIVLEAKNIGHQATRSFTWTAAVWTTPQ